MLERLYDYPPFLVKEQKMENGTIVYSEEEKTTDITIITPCGGYISEVKKDLIIHGYKTFSKGILGFIKGPKIRPVSEYEKDEIESKLVKIMNISGQVKFY